MRAYGLGLAGLALILVSCFSPKLDFENGALGCDNGACPPGFECRADQHCWKSGPQGGDAPTGPVIDGSVIDGSVIDGSVIDGSVVDGSVVDGPVGPPPDAPPSAPDAPPIECTGTEKSCASSMQPRHCSNGHWVNDAACGTGTVCASGQCTSTCSPDNPTVTCMNKCGSVINNCGTAVPCGDTCVADNGPLWSCGPSNTCVCARNVTQDCAGKCGTITDRCGVTVNCSGAGNGGVTCTNTGQICLSNHSCCTQDAITTTCPGTAGATCSATATNNCGVQVNCSASCSSDFPCDTTSKKCLCSANTKRCVDLGAGVTAEQTCISGTSWGNQTTCQFVCTNGMGCTGSCVPGTTQCLNSTQLQTCQGGTFTTSTCTGGTPVCGVPSGSTARCLVCAPNSFRCSTNGTGLPVRQQCAADGGSWATVENCAYTCTVGGAGPVCSGECHPNVDTRCSGGNIQTCGSNFMFGTPAACPDQLTCGANIMDKCSCAPGTTLCQDSSTVRTCNGPGTAWASATSCATGCSGTSCCESVADFCADRLCGSPTNGCGRQINCDSLGTCEQRYPFQHYGCGLAIAGKCTCDPALAFPCNGSSCSSIGDWNEVPECGDPSGNTICCLGPPFDRCCPAQTGCPSSGSGC